MESKKKGAGLHLTTGIITIALTALGMVLFLANFTTDYYIFGEMNSVLILVLLIGAMVAAAASMFFTHRLPHRFWPRLLTFLVTALLAAAALLLIGDRVEGIGNCIVSNYDSGHGGEEAIYMSLAGSVMMLVAMIYNIIGSFHDEANAPAGRAKTLGFSISAAALGVIAIVATLGLVGVDLTAGTGVSQGGLKKGTYTVSFNGNSGNLEDMPDYQFLCADFSGIAKYDSRLYTDISLELDGSGGYRLFSQVYCVESGVRCEIGDSTGLGQVITTNAEGTYTVNENGTVVTSAATHAVFEMATDTYSQQMKEAVGMNVNGRTEDGIYDSNDEPAVLAFVPETLWTLDRTANAIAAYTYANPEDDPNYVPEDTGAEPSEPDTEPVTIPSDDGATALAMVPSDDGATEMRFYADGTYRFWFEAYGIEDLGTYTYEGGVLTLTDANGRQTAAEGDPMRFTYAYSMSDQLTGSFTVPASALAGDDAMEKSALAVIPSDDGATEMRFYTDGTYRFWFEAYGIEDLGTYTYEGGVLTLTDANGRQTAAEGDPMRFTYAYSMSDQLTGSFTVPASAFQ